MGCQGFPLTPQSGPPLPECASWPWGGLQPLPNSWHPEHTRITCSATLDLVSLHHKSPFYKTRHKNTDRSKPRAGFHSDVRPEIKKLSAAQGLFPKWVHSGTPTAWLHPLWKAGELGAESSEDRGPKLSENVIDLTTAF